MRLFGYGVTGLIGIGALSVLTLSVWPGLLEEYFFKALLFSVIWVPLILIAFVIFAVRLYRQRHRDRLIPTPKWATLTIPIILLFTITSLALNIPCRIGFMISRSAFEELQKTISSPPTEPVALNRQAGLYLVDSYATDTRGGLFFRTHWGPDGIGPDTMSYGFAYQPNNTGSPFGNKAYATRKITGHWHWFRTSDDY